MSSGKKETVKCTLMLFAPLLPLTHFSMNSLLLIAVYAPNFSSTCLVFLPV